MGSSGLCHGAQNKRLSIRLISDKLFVFLRIFEVVEWFAQPLYMCLADLEKAFDHVRLSILWGVLWECEMSGPLYNHGESLVHIAGNKLDHYR